MKKMFPVLAKRALAFVLAFVLMLSLVPALSLPANADYTTDGWEYFGSYTWLEGRFHTEETDFVFEDNKPYDWKVTIFQQRTATSVNVEATVVNQEGKTVASLPSTPVTVSKGDSTMLSYSDLAELTTDLYGTFTLTCTVRVGTSPAAQLVQRFSRVCTNPITATVTSRSNPDNAFTFADPIDLVLNIKKNDGMATAYNAAVTVTKGSTELLAKRGVSLPASTNITLNVKDLVNLPAITTAGTYNVNLTLTDSTGAIKHQASFPFSVVALTGNLNASISSATSSNLTFDGGVPDLVVNLTKTDGIAEALRTAVTVKSSFGITVYSETFETTGANATVTPNLSTLSPTGTFTMTAVVTDDAGNARTTASATFTRTNSTPMTGTVTNKNADNTGNIYFYTGNSTTGDDISFNVKLVHEPSKGKTVYIKAVGTLNGKPFESTPLAVNFPTRNSTVNKPFSGTNLGAYGIFENISFVACDENGALLWAGTDTYSFSRVLSTAEPGDLPLLNMNDHFTSGKGNLALKIPMMAQVGANMWRSTVRWGYVEKQKGVYAVGTDLTNAMDDTQDNGMQALIILAYNNDNDKDPYTDGTQPLYGDPYVNLDAAFDDPNGNPWLVAYANYCYWLAEYMAKRYPDVVVGFEIWNEWNHSSMGKVPAESRTGAHYAMVVQAASAKIRQVNQKYGTNFKVIAGATAGDGYRAYETEDSSSGDFIEAMFKANGFFEAVDGVSFHTYSSIETTTQLDKYQGKRVFEYVSLEKHGFAARVTHYLGLVNEYNTTNKEIEIWLTETGWSTNSEKEVQPKGITGKNYDKYTYGATELEQAAYLVQMYAWALADGRLDRIFWYDFMNDLSNYRGNVWANDMTESNYGLIHNWDNSGDQPLAYSAKPGYVTMCALSSMLGNATYKDTLNLGSGIAAYRFTDKNGKDLVVAWTTSDTTKTLSCSGTMTVTDMYGNAKSGQTTATLSECPIYITYSGELSVG